MDLVVTRSNNWEAPFLNKPKTLSNLDYILTDNHQLIGILFARQRNPDHYHIEILAVHPDQRLKGYGRLIIQEFSVRLSPNSKITLFTQNKASEAFYQSLGFQCTQRFKKLIETSNDQEIIQRWSLTQNSSGAIAEYTYTT